MVVLIIIINIFITIIILIISYILFNIRLKSIYIEYENIIKLKCEEELQNAKNKFETFLSLIF